MKDIERPWIEIGYRSFAQAGPGGLKIERLSKAVHKNKSSFYHLFGDLENFTNVLLTFHLEQAKIIAEKESKCLTLEDLIAVLIEHKTDLLFSRQLRIYRENKAFEKCFQKSNELTLPAVVPIWSAIIGLNDNSYLAELVLQLSLENFYLQITDKTLNAEWLENYFNDVKTLIRHFKETGVSK